MLNTRALQTFQDWTKHIDAFKENIENTVQAGDITADTNVDQNITFYLDISEKAFIYTMPPIKQPATEMFERIKDTTPLLKGVLQKYYSNIIQIISKYFDQTDRTITAY